MVTYYHEFYKDFIEKYNILNGELTSQEKLNRSVNVVKLESSDNYNRLEIIRGAFALAWQDFTTYKEGQIVSYTTDPGLPTEVTKNYSVKQGQIAFNKVPDVEPLFWEEVTIDNYVSSINSVILSQYLNVNNTTPYTPTQDYNPATKLYVDNAVSHFYINGSPINGVNYLALNNTDAYTPVSDYHPATKLYVNNVLLDGLGDGTITAPSAVNSDKLGLRDSSEFITLYRDFEGDYNGMAVKNGDLRDSFNATDWIRTPANGLIPYDQNRTTDLGSEHWQFKAVYAVNFYGNYNSQAADIAEVYESDNNYEAGTVLEIGTDTEVTEFNGGILAGVVSSEPGIVLNSDFNGIKIALKGRVPVKIEGSANRGQYINAHEKGLGIACDHKTDRTIGVCLKNGSEIVEVKI